MRAWVTINKNDSLSKAVRGENKVGRSEERDERRGKEEGEKDSRSRSGKEPTSANGGVPQTETHSPKLCNSLLKQSHPGTLSSLHPVDSPSSAPDPSEPPREPHVII